MCDTPATIAAQSTAGTRPWTIPTRGACRMWRRFGICTSQAPGRAPAAATAPCWRAAWSVSARSWRACHAKAELRSPWLVVSRWWLGDARPDLEIANLHPKVKPWTPPVLRHPHHRAQGHAGGSFGQEWLAVVEPGGAGNIQV